MTQNGFQRGQVQVLYSYLPQALFSHQDYDICQVTAVDGAALPDVNRRVVLEAVRDGLIQWPDEDWRIGFPPLGPDGRLPSNEFLITTPRAVMFVPFPEMLQCQRCQGVYNADRLRSRQCPRPNCKGQLTQFRFVQAHNCGRLDTAYLNTKPCPQHGMDHIYFEDTGRVATAAWRCRACGGAFVARLRQGPCLCVYTQTMRERGAEHDSSMMRLFSATDPSLYRPRVTAFVNFSDEILQPLESDESTPLIFARIWGLLQAPVASIVGNRAIDSSASERELQLRAALASLAPEHELLRPSTDPAVNDAVQTVLRAVGLLSAEGWKSTKAAREHAAILDTVASQDIEHVSQQLLVIGDEAGAADIAAAGDFATNEMSLRDIRVLEAFPVGLCAYGFTRVSNNPNDACLVAFPAIDGQTPLYTIATDTEAIYIQIDPTRVVEWLRLNGLLAPGGTDAWAALYQDAELGQTLEPTPACAAVHALVHTMSHALLKNIELSGYSAQSLGEYVLSEGLAFVIFANRYTETKIGGLLSLFQHQLNTWLRAVVQFGRDCAFDPFCRSDGGSCAGCLHREHNCPRFNSALSRALLYGGPAKIVFGASVYEINIEHGFWGT